MRHVIVALLITALGGPALGVAAARAEDGAEGDAPVLAAATLPADLRLDVADVPGGRPALLCLALNDYWEARGESLAGRVAVAKVVLNRVADGRYPSDVCGVVTETRAEGTRACQFSWHCDGRPDVPGDGRAWRQSLLLASAVLLAGRSIDDPSGGALWYHATWVDQPAWSDRLAVTRTLGHHVFYRDPPVEDGPQLAAMLP
jgi:hypothetical protein